jgi:hypothetical protein
MKYFAGKPDTGSGADIWFIRATPIQLLCSQIKLNVLPYRAGNSEFSTVVPK